MSVSPFIARRRTARFLAALCALAALAALACPGAGTDADRPDPDELERLTMLGYVDSASQPADLSKSGVIAHAPLRAAPGVTLYTSHRPCRAQLLDIGGRTLNSWSETRNCPNWVNARLLPDGELLVIEGKGGLALQDWGGRTRWRRKLGAHHDSDLLPDGRFSVLLHERRAISDPTGAPEDANVPREITIVDDAVAVLNRDGSVVETLWLFDLIARSPDIELDWTPAPDLLHTNSVEWMRDPRLARQNPLYDLGNVVVSVRNQNRILIVDWDRAAIVWSWGAGILDRQHDASVLPNGNILLFDNGLERGWSRVLEVDPRSDRIEWEYGSAPGERFHSRGRGSVQRLANGNTLISVSDSGYAIEISPEREIVWELHNPNTVRRDDREHRAPIWARRYPPGWRTGNRSGAMR